ncbi:MAG: trypsin-like serine protease [Thermoleophilia bacterium]|nr:trypsin-like serine protease [Thermoleophilia bacterium]
MGKLQKVKAHRRGALPAVLVAAIIIVAFVLLAAGSAVAITGNWVTDNEHPFVGLVVIYDADGEFLWRGSGSLISPTVVLTAGHVVDTAEGAAWARVYFQQDAGAHYDPALGYDQVSLYPIGDSPDGNSRTGHLLYNYGFNNFAGFPNIKDVGVIILDEPFELSEYGQLPAPGILDELATKRGTRNTIFTVSGYGLTYKVQEHSALSNISYRSRLMAQSTLVNLRSALTDGYNLQTQGNGDGRGGTCSGDSGGPVFLGGPESNLIVGVTSFGMNSLCRGTDFAYRIDRQEVLDWIGQFLSD